MKLTILAIYLTVLSFSFNSCSLFQGEGGGGHCPAYGTQVDDFEKANTTEESLRFEMSERV
ncbi:MAG: hypothetical protein H6598_01945 [Flavobacteriales bacterium]|nr:hypothetical protein [Flavobacteriales bacterium]